MSDQPRAEQAFRDAFAREADHLDDSPLQVVRRRRRWPALAAAAAVLAVVGGSIAVAWTGDDGSDPEPAIATDPGPAPVHPKMTVTPAVALPGQVVSLTYADDFMRGIAYQLVHDEGSATDLDAPAYYLSASDERVSWASADQDYAWVDIGVGGPGPDRVQVPDDIEPGEWLVCTANAAEQRCASLTVTEGIPAPEPVEEIPADQAPPVTVRLDPSGDFLTVTTNGSSSCPELVASVSRLDDETLLVWTATLTVPPDAICTADVQPHRDTWPLVGDQAAGVTDAVVASVDTNRGVRVPATGRHG
jgi:hypothetical protein